MIRKKGRRTMKSASRLGAILIGMVGVIGLSATTQASPPIIGKPVAKVVRIPDPRWLYSIDFYLQRDPAFEPEIRPGDFVTIYDVPGLIVGLNFVIDPGGQIDLYWAATFSLVGVTPDFSPNPPPIDDDPNLLNITFRWTADVDFNLAAGQNEAYLGSFNFVGISEQSEIPEFLEYAAQTSIVGSNAKAANAGRVPTAVHIPEPTSFLLAGAGLAMVTAGYAVRRLRRRSAVAA